MLGNNVVGAMALYENVLEKLYVDPKYEGNCIGTLLFRWAENLMSQAGYAEMVFGAFPSSVGFYEKMGAISTASKVISGGPIKGCIVVMMRKRFPL